MVGDGARSLWQRRREVQVRRSTLRRNVSVGSGFTVGQRSTFWAPTGMTIGNNVHVGSDVRVEADGSIGDFVLLANSCAIIGRADHGMRQVGAPITETEWVGNNPAALSKRFTIGSDVWIGYGSVILSGVRIGDSAVVAAGSVVVADVASNTIVAGNPAKSIGSRFTDDQFVEHWAILQARGLKRIVEINSEPPGVG